MTKTVTQSSYKYAESSELNLIQRELELENFNKDVAFGPFGPI